MAFNSNYLSISNKDLEYDNNLRWSNAEQFQSHRGAFSKDRDRVLYSKSFMRLRGKTQVFMLQDNDYLRTRLTHTLAVSQVARSIATELGLNMELVETIALGHDVGHTPFGHIGERTLRAILEEDDATPKEKKGFKHNLQALRLFCDLEKGADYPEVKGLNLTKYALWGIAHHSSIMRKPIEYDGLGNPIDPDVIHTENPFYDHYLNEIKNYWSFEGYVVAIADEIAQRHHDIEDSLQFGVLSRKTIVDRLADFRPLFTEADEVTFERLKKGIDTMAESVFTSVYSRLVINIYVVNAINQTKLNMRFFEQQYNINSQSDFSHIKKSIPEVAYSKIISFSDELTQIDKSFQEFMMTSVLSSFPAQAMDGKGESIVRRLYVAFADNPIQLPDSAIKSFCIHIGIPFDRSQVCGRLDANVATMHRCIVDYIGGMTDGYAYREYDRLYGTKF